VRSQRLKNTIIVSVSQIVDAFMAKTHWNNVVTNLNFVFKLSVVFFIFNQKCQVLLQIFLKKYKQEFAQFPTTLKAR